MPSSTAMPIIETPRLLVRPLTMDDLEPIHQLLDIEAWQTGKTREQRRVWLQWSVLSYEALADLHQPPYGERAVVLKSTGELVAAVGLVPSMSYFDRLPSFGGDTSCEFMRPEFGMFWATRTAHLTSGYASEAAQGVLDHAFGVLKWARLIATTDYDNLASQAVMRHLGMSIEHNPRPDPPWFQVAGVLKKPAIQEQQ